MITNKKMDSRILVACIMNRNMEILENMYDSEYIDFFVGNTDKNICLINELMKQICDDQAKNNLRSAFRKAILLNRILKKITNIGDI